MPPSLIWVCAITWSCLELLEPFHATSAHDKFNIIYTLITFSGTLHILSKVSR